MYFVNRSFLDTRNLLCNSTYHLYDTFPEAGLQDILLIKLIRAVLLHTCTLPLYKRIRRDFGPHVMAQERLDNRPFSSRDLDDILIEIIIHRWPSRSVWAAQSFWL